MTKMYARINDGRVAELTEYDSDPSTVFHPAVRWIDVSGVTGIALGWEFDGQRFSRPALPESAPNAMSLAALQARLSDLAAQIALLSRNGSA